MTNKEHTKATKNNREDKSNIALAPFIHKFKTKNNSYIFDVNSGEILCVDDVVWQIIEDSNLDKQEIISKYINKFTHEQITNACDEIQKFKAENTFFSNRHPNIMIPYSLEQVSQLLDTSRTSITLNVTERCNFRCTYCESNYHKDGTPRYSQRDMSWEVAKASIDDFLQHCILSTNKDESVHLGFYGGEPLLNFPLIKKCTEYILEKTGSNNVTFGMTTNGYLLKDEIADFLGTNKFGLLVSMDGTQAIHDSQRRTVNNLPTWDVVKNNVREFTVRYPNSIPRFNCTLGHNVNIYETLRCISSKPELSPCHKLRISLASEAYNGYYKNDSQIKKSFPGAGELYNEFQKYLETGRMDVIRQSRGGIELEDNRIQYMREGYGSRFLDIHWRRWKLAEARGRTCYISPNTPCLPGLHRMLVAVDGKYLMCEKFSPDIDETYEFGNAFVGIDNKKAYQIFKDFYDYTLEDCKYCWCLPICNIGCYVAVIKAFGRNAQMMTKTMKEKVCERDRTRLHDKLVEYSTILEKNPKAFDFFSYYWSSYRDYLEGKKVFPQKVSG